MLTKNQNRIEPSNSYRLLAEIVSFRDLRFVFDNIFHIQVDLQHNLVPDGSVNTHIRKLLRFLYIVVLLVSGEFSNRK